MTVRIMSAQPPCFNSDFHCLRDRKHRKNGPGREERFPPKAEVTSSNLVGRATARFCTKLLPGGARMTHQAVDSRT